MTTKKEKNKRNQKKQKRAKYTRRVFTLIHRQQKSLPNGITVDNLPLAEAVAVRVAKGQRSFGAQRALHGAVDEEKAVNRLLAKLQRYGAAFGASKNTIRKIRRRAFPTSGPVVVISQKNVKLEILDEQ